MSLKKRLVMLGAAAALVLGLCAGANILTDSLGVSGDPVPHRYSSDETNNPRAAKLTWLEEHGGEFNSYVIGSSSAASYSAEELNEYLGAKFYNLSVWGSDAKDYRELAAYLLEHCTVKHLILNLDISEANAYGVSSGCGDRRLRDVEKIGDMGVYEAAHGADFNVSPNTERLPRADQCVQSVAEIRDMCRENGAELTVIVSPVYISQWEAYGQETLRQFKTALARVTDYWDFSMTPVSLDSRYFYDAAHFRNAVGTMVLAEIFGNPSVWRPEGFGTYVTAENCADYLDALFSAPPVSDPAGYTADVPILLYHHIDADPAGDTAVTPETFEAHIRTLAEGGYTAVTLPEMIDYVWHGGALPEKPVCITFDDGYLSNYEYAWPILEKYGMKATIFAIGVSVGHKEFYKDTDFRLTPHFGWDEAREMVDSGVIDVQSHTYDLHQWEPFESGDQIRSSVLPLEGETEQEYAAVLLEDIERYEAERKAELGEGFYALAYPGGCYNDLTEVLIHQAGIPVTLSCRTDSRNVLVRGLPQSLYALCRWNVTGQTTAETLLDIVGGK